MKGRFGNMKIRTKIMLMYALILCLSLTISVTTITLMNRNYMEQQIGEATVQTVDALRENLSIMFENVEQFSNMIYFDKDVQKVLASTESIAIDPAINQTIQKSLVNMLLSANYIESVFVFDRFFNNYSSKKIAPIHVTSENIPTTSWYQRADEMNGQSIYTFDTEGVFRYPTRPDYRGISMVRAINSEVDYERLALLIVNVNESTITKFFDDVGSKYGAKYCIVDGAGNFVIYPPEASEEMQTMIKQVLQEPDTEQDYETQSLWQDKFCVAKEELGIEDWYLVGVVPMDTKLLTGSFQKSIILLFVVLNVAVMAICSMTLFRLIFRPLFEMEDYMAHAENAVFTEIPVEGYGNNEITRLKRRFNSMVVAIEELLDKVKEEEKTLARNEFEILQAQINPHFLYNTLDGISALALTKQHDNCFKMTQALGQFYRNSLNSGKQVITVQDEMECLKNYATILNIRYDNKINLICDVQEEILKCHMLKLVLQPIVENAIHHGIRNKEGIGTISITGYGDEEELVFMVEDDGLGMTEEKIEEIMKGKSQKGKSGFGLYSGIQRISLFYDIKNPIKITSEINSGTQITVCLKRL